MKTSHLLATLTAALVLGIAAALWATGESRPPTPPELVNVVLPDPRPIPAFSLIDNHGEPFDAARLQDHWTFLFFGYTHCPDICPTALLTLTQARSKLEGAPAALDGAQFLFVSVDPKRDTPEYLNTYVQYFHPDFIGATGERGDIDRLVQLAGAVYMFEGDTSSSDYIVNHSATLYLIDPQGRLYARISPPHEPGEIADLFTKVRQHYGDLPQG